MFNKKKQSYASVNTHMSRRSHPGAPSSANGTDAGKTEKMNPQTALAESVEKVICNTHLEEKSIEEEMGLGKQASSLPKGVLHSQAGDDDSQQVATVCFYPQLRMAEDGVTMIPDEASLILVSTETTAKKNKIAKTPAVVETCNNMIIPRNKGMQSAGHWSKKERDCFSLALKVFGSNFFAMEMIFKTRNRRELKNQFKFLVKTNPRLLDESKSDKRSLIELLQALAVPEMEGMVPKGTPTKGTPSNGTPSKRKKKKKELTGSKKNKIAATTSPLTSALVSSFATSGDVTRVVQKKMVVPRMSNIVASVNLSCKVDIKTIVKTLLNSEWDPKQPCRVALRLSTSTANIFESGKMMCFGTRSVCQTLRDMRKYASLIQHCGNAEVKFKNFEVVTIAASATVAYHIKLEAIALKFSSCCRYTPDVAPGLKYQMNDPPVTFNIFSSGNIVLAGGKSEDDVKRAFVRILEIVEEFKKQ